mgnify:CR=1 FL=1
MRIHRALAQQARAFVHIQVAARLRKQLAHPADFVGVLGQVRLDPHVRVLLGQFARAVQLLKSMDTEEERERATVYMEGLAQMQKDWSRESRSGKSRPQGSPTGKRTSKPGTQSGKPSRPAKKPRR